MSYSVKSVTNNQYKLKVVTSGGALVVAPATVPTVTATSISDLSAYATSAAMLANDATTYANTVAYVDGRSFVNSSQLSANLTNYVNISQLSANLANYTPTSSLQMSTLTDVVANSSADNATLVYQVSDNKYVVKQLDLDGGSF